MPNSLIVEERSGYGLATVMGRKGVSATALGNALGFSPPEGPARVKHDGLAWIGTGPATWLAMTDAPEIGCGSLAVEFVACRVPLLDTHYPERLGAVGDGIEVLSNFEECAHESVAV